MQVYQAAEEFSKNYSCYDKVWYIQYSEEGSYYMVVKDYDYRIGFTLDVVGRGVYLDIAFITKQRGGIRRFSSPEAALNVIRQIGQKRVKVEL